MQFLIVLMISVQVFAQVGFDPMNAPIDPNVFAERKNVNHALNWIGISVGSAALKAVHQKMREYANFFYERASFQEMASGTSSNQGAAYSGDWGLLKLTTQFGGLGMWGAPQDPGGKPPLGGPSRAGAGGEPGGFPSASSAVSLPRRGNLGNESEVLREFTFLAAPKPVEVGHPIQPTHWYPVGTGRSVICCRFDVNPETCLNYFGIVPGQYLNGNAVFVGLRLNETTQTVQLWAHVQGSPGAGTYPPDKQLRACNSFVSIPYVPESSIVTVESPAIVPGLELIPDTYVRFGLPGGSDKPVAALKIDTDPTRCLRYAGILPGQPLKGPATFLGLVRSWKQPGHVELIFYVTVESGKPPAAGTYPPGTSLLRLDDAINSVEPYTHRTIEEVPENSTGSFFRVPVPEALGPDSHLGQIGLVEGQRGEHRTGVFFTVARLEAMRLWVRFDGSDALTPLIPGSQVKIYDNLTTTCWHLIR